MKNNEHSAAEWTERTPLCCLVFDDVFVTYLQWFQVAPDAKFGDSQRVTTPPPKIAVKLGAQEKELQHRRLDHVPAPAVSASSHLQTLLQSISDPSEGLGWGQ